MESPADTIPGVPSWEFDPEGCKNDFARLIPLSPLARRAFNELVGILEADHNALKHARNFIHYVRMESEEHEAPHRPPEQLDELRSVMQFRDSEDSGALCMYGDDLEGSEGSIEEAYKWCGYYRLNLDIPPKHINLGWVIGSSNSRMPEHHVDFRLTPRPGQHGVRERHARFLHNKESGVLMLHADSWPVLVDGKSVLRNAAIAICDKTGVGLGDLAYSIDFTSDMDPEKYQKQLRSVNNQRRGSAVPTFLTPTPTPSLRRRSEDKYYIYPVAAGGASSTVSHAYTKATGKSVAIKKMTRNDRHASLIRNEVEILRKMNHSNIVQLVEVIGFERGPRNVVDEVILVLAPFAPPLFEHLGRHDRPWILTVIRQCFSGLEYIHSLGIMHRDLKLTNIGIFNADPPRAVLLDFGHASSAPTSTDHLKGTLPYLAPEIMALKNKTSKTPFNRSIDVWALGLCLFELFNGTRVKWQSINSEEYRWLRNELISAGERNESAVTNDETTRRLIDVMTRSINWTPEKRCKARRALEVLGEEEPIAVADTEPRTGDKRRRDI